MDGVDDRLGWPTLMIRVWFGASSTRRTCHMAYGVQRIKSTELRATWDTATGTLATTGRTGSLVSPVTEATKRPLIEAGFRRHN